MSGHEENINIRINKNLRAAVKSCAKSIDEKPSVFIRKALVNRLADNGITDFTLGDAEGWPADEKDK